MILQAHIDDFISYLAMVRRLSDNTTKAYRRDLQMLAIGLDATPIANTSSAVLRRLLAKYMAKRCASFHGDKTAGGLADVF